MIELVAVCAVVGWLIGVGLFAFGLDRGWWPGL